MLSKRGGAPLDNTGGAMARPKTRSELLQAALKRKELEVVPHKQMKNFMALKNKIINTDELIKRYQGKAAQFEINKQSLKEAQSQVITMEQGMKGLRAELQALHEENEQLKARLVQQDSELEAMKITNHEDTLLLDQMTVQLQENVKIKEEYDLLSKTHSHTNHECEKWKKLYQRLRREYDALKLNKGGRKRRKSSHTLVPSGTFSLPQLSSPPYCGDMCDGDSDIKSINSPASVFSLPARLTTFNNNDGGVVVSVKETEATEEKNLRAVVSPVSSKISINSDLCFSPPMTNGYSTSTLSLELANGAKHCEPIVLEDDKTLDSCDTSTKKMKEDICIESEDPLPPLLQTTTLSTKKMAAMETVKLKDQLFGEDSSDDDNLSVSDSPLPPLLQTTTLSTKKMAAMETVKLKDQLFGEDSSDDDNLSVSDSSSCCSESSLTSVDDLADLLSVEKNKNVAGTTGRDSSNDPSMADCKSMSLEPLDSLCSGEVEMLCSTIDVIEVDLPTNADSSEKNSQQTKNTTNSPARDDNDGCVSSMVDVNNIIDLETRTGGPSEEELIKNAPVTYDAVISENNPTSESALIELDGNQQQLSNDPTLPMCNLLSSQQVSSSLQNQPSDMDGQQSATTEEEQVLCVVSQQLSNLSDMELSGVVREESTSSASGGHDHGADSHSTKQHVHVHVPHIEVAVANATSDEDSDEELDTSFATLFQFQFQTLSPIPPSPDNLHSDLYTPLSPIPPTLCNHQQQAPSPLPMSPLKSLSPLPQSPNDKSSPSVSPINAHNKPPALSQAVSTDSYTHNPSPLQFEAIVPEGVQIPTPCCVEVNVAACGDTSTCTSSPTKSTPPTSRQLKLSDSSPFSPPCPSTSISRSSEDMVKNGDDPSCVSPPKFLATPLILPSNIDSEPSGNTRECVLNSSNVSTEKTVLSSHSDNTPAVSQIKGGELTESPPATVAVSNSVVDIKTEISTCEKVHPDTSVFMDHGEFTESSETSLLSPSVTPPTPDNTVSVKSNVKLQPIGEEPMLEKDSSQDKDCTDKKALLSSPFEDGEISNDEEHPLQRSFVAASSKGKQKEPLTVKPKDIFLDGKQGQMNTEQSFTECGALYSSSSVQTSSCTKKMKIQKNSAKKPKRSFTKSNSISTSSFDDLLSSFSSQRPPKNQSKPKHTKVNGVPDPSLPKRKQIKLHATNSHSSLSHLKDAALEARKKQNTCVEPSSILPLKQTATESTRETPPLVVSSTDATPVYVLPGYQLRSREAKSVSINVRKRSLSGDSVGEAPRPQKIRKMSEHLNDLMGTETEMIVLQSNESSQPSSQDDDSMDELQVVIDGDVDVQPDLAFKVESGTPVSDTTQSGQTSNGESSTDVGGVPVLPKRSVRQTDGATGQVEDRTPANSPKGFESGPVKNKPVVSVASIGYGQPQMSSLTILNGGKEQQLQNGSSSPEDDVFNTPLPLVGNTVSSQQQQQQQHLLPQLSNSTHMGGAKGYALSPAQQQLNVCMQCSLPLPEWLVSSMTKVQSMHQHCAASGKGVSKKKRNNMKTPIMKQPKQKTIDYIMLNLERMVCGHLHLSAMITMFTNQKNVSNLPELVQATMKFLLESYNPKTEHVISLYHSLCDTVRTYPAVLNPYTTSFPPCLLRPECQIVALFAHICRMCPPLASVLNELNKALYQAILQPNLKFHKLAALIRLFTAICRLQNDKDRLLFLCFDLIKKPLQPKELPVIGGVASVWPLPLARNETVQLFTATRHLSCKGLEQQVLSYTLEVVVLRIFNSQKAKLHDSFSKNLYTLCRWNSTGLIQQVNHLTETLIEVLKTSKLVYIDAVPPEYNPWRRPCPSILAYHVVQSLRLLSFQQGWVWTNDTLIRAHLWPLLQQWNKDRESVRDAVIVCVVRLIGFVSKQGLNGETGSQSILQLQRVLKALLLKSGAKPTSTTPGSTKIPLHIQLAAIDSLFELCPPSHPNANSIMDGVKACLQSYSSLPCGAVLMKEFEPQLREFALHSVVP